MTEKELIEKYKKEQGKQKIIFVKPISIIDEKENFIKCDYVKVLTLDFYQWLIEQL